MRISLLALLFLTAPLPVPASPWYSGCGNGPGATACLNNRELERIARGHTLQLIDHNDRTEAVVRDRNGNVVSAPPTPSSQRVQGTTNVFTDPDNPGGIDVTAQRALPNPPPLDRPSITPVEAPANSALETAADAEYKAQQKALEQAAEAERKAAERRYVAEYEKAYAESLARAYDQLQAFVQPREQSQDARLRAEAQARLQEVPQLGERFRDMTSAASLPTNGALRVRAQDYVVRLDEDSERQEREASRLEADASRGRLAAKEMAAHRKTLGRRLANLNSVSSQQAVNSLTSSVSAGEGAGAAFGKGQKNGVSDVTGADEMSLRSGRAAGVSRAPASLGVAKPDGVSEIVIDPKTGKPAKGDSLRELLRRKMAARQTGGQKGGAAEAASAESSPAKSGFAQFFEERKGGGTNVASGADGEPARDQPGFFLSGPETDKVVAGFVGSVGREDSRGGPEVFGDSGLNIFERMTSYLRKCQQQRRVGQTGG